MVAILLATLLMTGVLMGSGATVNARVKSAATLLVSGIRVAYGRASSTSHPMRLVLDIDQSKVILEESTKPMLVRRNDETAAAGAEGSTPEETEAIQQAEKIMKGPRAPRAIFSPVKALGFDVDDPSSGRDLGSGVKIKRIEVSHSKEPQIEGRGYLYFWPGGMTERAAIQLGRAGSTDVLLTVVVFPLMGRAKVVGGAQSIEPEREDKGEREDRGF